MAFLIGGANSAADTGYNIANSLRVNQADSAYLSDAVSSPNTDIFTISMWIKPVPRESGTETFFEIGKALTGEAGDYTTFEAHTGYGRIDFGAYDGVNNAYRIRWGSPGTFRYRDPAAWLHIVMRMDSSQGVAASRARFYVNGEDISSRLTQTTSPSQNDDYFHATGSSVYFPGGGVNDANYFDGYIAECAYIDGTSYAASTFAETDEDSGIWKPKDFKDDVTFGTNGLYLEFKQSGTGTNSSGLGADTSGNDNHMAVTNFATTDQCVDTPTNNFAVLNQLAITNSDSVLSEGNTVHKVTGGNAWIGAWSTLGAANGKWYAEVKVIADNNTSWGVIQSGGDSVANFNTDNSGYVGKYADGWGWWGNATAETIHNNSGSAYGTEEAEDDIFMIAVDIDGGKWWIGKNGTWFDAPGTSDTGDPANGNYPGIGSISFTDFVHFASGLEAADSDDSIVAWNFGNPFFAISSGNADANGYGNFEYAVPSGFYALCTKNLAEFG